MSCASLSAAAWAAVVTSSRERSVAVTTRLSVGGHYALQGLTDRPGHLTHLRAQPARPLRTGVVVLAQDDRHPGARRDLALGDGARRQAQRLGDLGGVLLVGGLGVDDPGRRRGAG